MLGGPDYPGAMSLFNPGHSNSADLNLGSYPSFGGYASASDELGNLSWFLWPDLDGSGGYLHVSRNASGGQGFVVDGNAGGSGNPTVSILGTSTSAVFNMNGGSLSLLGPSSSTVFDMNNASMTLLGASSGATLSMNNTGDAAVQLPTNAISATEVVDEAGVASASSNPTIGQYLGAIIAPTVFTTITAPAAGYALVLATAELKFEHTNGTSSEAILGVSTTINSFPNTQDHAVVISSNAPSGTYTQAVTVHGLFQVSAGANTFYLNGWGSSGSLLPEVQDIQLTAIYLPTAYGTVDPTAVASSAAPAGDSGTFAALTPSGPAEEQAAVFHPRRIERELDAVRAELEALKRQLSAQADAVARLARVGAEKRK
jgi:hypothetical protein